MKRIPLTQGKFATVDDEDYDYLMQWKWSASQNHGNWYATRQVRRKKNCQDTVFMHRDLLGLKRGDGLSVDHKDTNGLNNVKTNLRLCSNQQNQWNRRPYTEKSSIYKGVSWFRQSKKWKAQIRYDYGLLYLGLFDDQIDAARAYDKKAKELFGEFARPNFPKRRPHVQDSICLL